MLTDDEFFGTPERVALAKRSASLWSLLKDNPSYAYYGRLVALSDPTLDSADILCALARLQGAAASYYVPAKEADALFAQLATRGLASDRYEIFRGEEAALEASRRVVKDLAVPADLSISAIDADTPRELVRDVAALCQSCDVMPVPGSIMRGRDIKGICLIAVERNGRPVASASSYLIHHALNPHAKDAFWGMLATTPDRRGEKIAMSLGARAIIHMWEHHGARGFMTGIKAGNSPSENLCRKLGVDATDLISAHCIDKTMFGEASVTR